MSNYDDGHGGVQDAPMSGDRGGTVTGYAPYRQAPPAPYGYGMQRQMRPRRVYPVETKPFFLTSEFIGAVLAVAGIAITAASTDAFGAWRAWILISAVTIGYMVSRGNAKSGTRSHADDFRENFSFGGGSDSSGQDGR